MNTGSCLTCKYFEETFGTVQVGYCHRDGTQITHYLYAGDIVNSRCKCTQYSVANPDPMICSKNCDLFGECDAVDKRACLRDTIKYQQDEGLQEFPFSQTPKIHDLTRCVLCGNHFKSSELGIRVAAGWIHHDQDKCKQEAPK